PSPRYRLYVSRFTAVITQRLSKREDGLRQVRLFNKRVRPNLFQQLVPFNELAGIRDQPDQYLCRFRPQRNHFPGAREQTIIQVELKWSKFEPRAMRH